VIQHLYNFQNLIVGALGFLGVTVTLAVNAWLARRQRSEEREHERESLRTGLIEEFKVHLNGMQSNVQAMNKELEERQKYSSAHVPTDSMDDVYHAFVPRLGLLSVDEVREVLNAALSLRAFRANLFLYGSPADAGERHVSIPEKHAPNLIQGYENLIPRLQKTIETLEAAASPNRKGA